ncbi:hypothetical protein Tco_1145600 [Tanacetum coccineum]|uniref:Uncharacterized protein n=1 Tax=Tanacetum coccineum TaxID=301880 RepID=A0ABQ5HNI6_9ASTR
MRITYARMDSSITHPEGIQFLVQRHIRAESDQKDKMRHAMDDNGIPSKEIHERHRETCDNCGVRPKNDTKLLTIRF